MEPHEPIAKGDAARASPSVKSAEPAAPSGRLSGGPRLPARAARWQRMVGNRAVAALFASKQAARPKRSANEPDERNAPNGSSGAPVVQTAPTVTAVVAPADV